MATVARQPFAPLDGARLQTLTSLKNRQNAVASPSSNGKRKAELLDGDDFENVNPLVFAKRSKPADSATHLLKRPSPRLALTPRHDARPVSSPPAPASTPRRVLQPRSPVARIRTGLAKSSPMSAPAGRSPTRGKRSGILSSRRRTSGLYARLDPPSFNLEDAAAAPFSLDAALRGTIAPYGARPSKPASGLDLLAESEVKASWFFDIHEDSPEQEMTNLLQHSTCVLDISSDEESEQKARRHRDEGRDKENIPPSDDISQTSARRATPCPAEDMLVDKDRVALAEMNTADFYAEGCDESSVVIVPADDDGPPGSPRAPLADDVEALANVELLMSSPSDGSSKAAVLQPIEGTGESFELWESGSAQGETEAPVAAS